MSDIFREVDEEYRQEQFLRFWHENAKSIILILIVAIAVASGISLWKAHHRKMQEEQTLALSQALDTTDGKPPAEARDIMVKAADTLTGSRKVAAEMAAARFAAKAGDTDGAVKLYAAVADDHDATDSAAIARISSLTLRIDSGDPDQLSKELQPFTGDDNPYRFSARQLEGVLALRQRDYAKAKDIFTALAADPATPPGIKQTAQALQTIAPLPAAPATNVAAPAAPASAK
jgi:hypothetical protein